MFGKRSGPPEQPPAAQPPKPATAFTPAPVRPATPAPTPISQGTVPMADHDSSGFRPEVARPSRDLPGMSRPIAPVAPSAPPPSSDDKKLIVGRNIVLSGQITACDKLVVEGRVDATLTESRVIEITSTGVFKGAAEIDEALIGGTFEGTLICRGRLLIRASGKVKGEIRYGQLEIECGGELIGDINTVQGKPLASGAATAAPAPAPAAVVTPVSFSTASEGGTLV